MIPDPLCQEDWRRWPGEATMILTRVFTPRLTSSTLAITLLGVIPVITSGGCRQLSPQRSGPGDTPTSRPDPAFQTDALPELHPSGFPTLPPPMPPAETDFPPLPGASAQGERPHRIGGFTTPRFEELPGNKETASETVDVDGPALTVPPHFTIQRTAGVEELEPSATEEMVEPLGANKQRNSGPSINERDAGLFHQSDKGFPRASAVLESADEAKVPLPTEVATEQNLTAVVEFDRHLFLLELFQDDHETQKPAVPFMVTSSDLPAVSHRPANAPQIAGEPDSWMSSGFPYDMVITPGPMANRWSRTLTSSATTTAQPEAWRPHRLAAGGLNWELRPVE